MSRLTDEEVCRKYGIARDDPSFATARALSDNRPDRTICTVPEIVCPHCGQGFTANWIDISQGPEMPCDECERIIWIEHIEVPEDENSGGDVIVTLNTHDPITLDPDDDGTTFGDYPEIVCPYCYEFAFDQTKRRDSPFGVGDQITCYSCQRPLYVVEENDESLETTLSVYPLEKPQ